MRHGSLTPIAENFFLKQVSGDRAEFMTFSFWESREAIESFAGHDIDKAVYYPEDDRYLMMDIELQALSLTIRFICYDSYYQS
jgi:hypothetical protein